jgi:uncharacterized protein YwgA
MDTGQRNIAALLSSLNLDFDIHNVASRKLLQKLVYLAQALGLPVYYSFNWYLHGPYSPRLTKDYYDLKSHLEMGESIATYKLAEKYSQISRSVLSLLDAKPADTALEDWAELLASLSFLRTESGYDNKTAREFLAKKKPHVADHFTEAKKALTSVGLLEA